MKADIEDGVDSRLNSNKLAILKISKIILKEKSIDRCAVVQYSTTRSYSYRFSVVGVFTWHEPVKCQ